MVAQSGSPSQGEVTDPKCVWSHRNRGWKLGLPVSEVKGGAGPAEERRRCGLWKGPEVSTGPHMDPYTGPRSLGTVGE